MSHHRRQTFCPNCGEYVDPGLSEEMGKADCDNCCMRVEPITDAADAGMPFKAKHPIRCDGCGERVALSGLHMGEYTDGVIVACECMSLASVPYELGEPELPDQWEIVHDAELDNGRTSPEADPAPNRQLGSSGGRNGE
jgi:hypothetical protein